MKTSEVYRIVVTAFESVSRDDVVAKLKANAHFLKSEMELSDSLKSNRPKTLEALFGLERSA